MGSFRYDYDDDGIQYEGGAEVHCYKGKQGIYSLYSSWSLLTPNLHRPLMFASMRFKMAPGGYLSFFQNYDSDFKTFKRTARLLNRLIDMADSEDKAPYLALGVPPHLYGIRIDKNNITVNRYVPEDDSPSRKYRFTDKQLPKPMMECICDFGIASGLINFDNARKRS
ncbi:hypothetical protein [Vibrio algivorus]|nr:hypothetical protein [Vibrio algivorus]